MSYRKVEERLGIQKGLEQGRQEGLEQGRREGLLSGIEALLHFRFGDAAQPLLAEIRQLETLAQVEAVFERLKTARSPDEIRQVYQSPEAE